MKTSFPFLSAFLILGLCMTFFAGSVPVGLALASSPVGERPDALKLRFSIKDEHIVNWKRQEKGMRIQMSPGATASFHRFTSSHLNQAFDLYINDLFVISIMNTRPVKTGGLFISVRKAEQDRVVNYLPMRKEKLD